MTTVPIERRRPSLELVGAAASIPLVLYGVQFLVFDVMAGGRLVSRRVEYETALLIFALQWVAYGYGVYCIRRLRIECPRPATLFGRWFTGLTCLAFLVGAGLWCAFVSLIVLMMTFFAD